MEEKEILLKNQTLAGQNLWYYYDSFWVLKRALEVPEFSLDFGKTYSWKQILRNLILLLSWKMTQKAFDRTIGFLGKVLGTV